MMEEMKQVMDNENQEIEKNLNENHKKIFTEMINERMKQKPPMPPPPGH